ncbi:hypothetical protein [Chromobacterium sp. IIBBL 290-4]|uniref:hypothetical protein n=1 Tax=Chromobacterium sp. IIBBL 290-4 TaxID=2953890 RepID=UPI0020B823B6|nr:hypothetical protein [Chromobacterium sp. IIBBL 290-4]UTH72230.1 hypothetical protein NKT35_11750 [Chromobacterium sp. IIBBL 290-4]
MAHYVLSPKIEAKLRTKHNIQPHELDEAFFNRNGPYIADTRAVHQTNPPTEWFLARTDTGRLLKIVVVYDPPRGTFIKTAFEAAAADIATYTAVTGIAETLL